MRTRTGSPRILSWQITPPQRSLLAAPPLDMGNEDSGNEIDSLPLLALAPILGSSVLVLKRIYSRNWQVEIL